MRKEKKMMKRKKKKTRARDTERCFNTKLYAVSRLKSIEGRNMIHLSF